MSYLSFAFAGPAQQSISVNICKPNPCSLCWPGIPFANCNAAIDSNYENVTLRDIYIYKPIGSPGVILGDENNPIEHITFENVLVQRSSDIFRPQY